MDNDLSSNTYYEYNLPDENAWYPAIELLINQKVQFMLNWPG